MTNLTDLGVAALRDGVKAGTFSAREAAEAWIAAVEKGRPLNAYVVETPEHALAAAVGPHDADAEAAAGDLGEGDPVAARRPHRRGIAAIAEADAPLAAAARAHDIELLAAAAVGVEDDLGAVVGIARRGVDGGRVGEPPQRAAAHVHLVDVGLRLAIRPIGDPRSVGREDGRPLVDGV